MTDADKLTQHHQDYQFAVTKALSQAIRALDRADRHASVLADIVRQQVEHRLDIAFTSGDPGVLRDSQYQAVLVAYPPHPWHAPGGTRRLCPMGGTVVTGTVYLLHFDQPYRHARHYCGWTTNLTHRLAEHTLGHGARLLAVIRPAGIDWTLARTWTGDRTRERQLKTQGGASRRCPLCGITPRTKGPQL